jgi:hypothetical protein
MEDEVYDDANVGYYFLWPSVGVGIEPYIPDPTDPVYTYPAPYNFWLTLRGLTEKYGHGTAGGSEQVMQDLWEALSKGTTPSPVNALALALQNKGDVLADRVHDYVVAERFSRGCTGGYSGPYCLQEGDDYVSTVGAPPLDPSESMASVGDSWPPYYRATNGNYGTLDASLPSGSNYAVSITNQTERGSLFARVACDTGSSIQILGTASGVTARQTSSLGTIDTSGCSSPPYAWLPTTSSGGSRATWASLLSASSW